MLLSLYTKPVLSGTPGYARTELRKSSPEFGTEILSVKGKIFEDQYHEL